jgi:hypothetical protein
MAEHDVLLKRNLIRLVVDHRNKCNADCNVSLDLILAVAERAGIAFSDEERTLFQ